ncbi:MAG: carbohydrate-binding protein [Firmicutes bacterium]|nr:carbohydrate-binding protein [Bacillota bacterium]
MKKSFFVRLSVFCMVLSLIMISSMDFTSAASAVQVKSFSISSGGTGTRMRVGDLNSDGRLDFLVVQATSETPSQVNMLTAYNHNGTQMWQVGGPSNGITGTDRDEPVQIYDIDNDRQNEVLCVMNKKFRILNGSNGQLEKEYNLPMSTAHDCILICNLTGKSWPSDIILKDRYTNAYAMDINFNRLWSFSGATGHYPWNYDFDNDGRDEIMMSYVYLDHDGRQVWQCSDATDHADCIQIGNIDGNSSNGMEIALGTQGNYTVQVYNWNGSLQWRNNTIIEGQQLIVQDYRPSTNGLEIYGLDRINRSTPGQDALFIFGATGSLLWKENPPNSNGYGTAIKKVPNWDGTNKAMILAFKRGGSLLPGLYDGNGTKVVEFPVDGNAMIGDFCGDSKTEVLMYTSTTAYIYASASVDYNTPAPNPGNMRPQLKEDYNFSRYGSGECLSSGGGPVATPTPTRQAATPTPTRRVPTPTPGGSVTYQAENASYGGGAVTESTNGGYNGTGYINFPSSGGYLQFNNVDGGSGGTKTLKFRFALGVTSSRTGRIQINGGAWQNITFNPTGAWTTWNIFSYNATLNSGAVNTVRLESTGQDLANIDQLEI